MFQIALSQITTARWELPRELPCFANNGFSSVALWRHKISDFTNDEIQLLFQEYSMNASSVQWAGGFTGSDGRSFEESLTDAEDAIHLASSLKCPIVVLHSGSRGGHTLSHARRLLADAIESLIPVANQKNVQLALKPLHPHASAGCSFLTELTDAIALIDQFNECSLLNRPVGLSLDLWHFADDPHLLDHLPDLVRRTLVIQVADRTAPPSNEHERLPVGRGMLPLKDIASQCIAAGYDGVFEFDPIGEAVEAVGYESVIHTLSNIAACWSNTLGTHQLQAAQQTHQPDYLRRPSSVSRKSQASNQVVSPG